MRAGLWMALPVLISGCSTEKSDNSTASVTGTSPPTTQASSGLLSEIVPTYTSSGCKMYSDAARTRLVGELSSQNVDKSTSKIHTYWRIGINGSTEEDFFIFDPNSISDRSTQKTPSMIISELDRFPGQICTIGGGCGTYSGSGTLVINGSSPDKIHLVCG